MTGPYPEIQGGGSLILAWQIRNRHVLVIGGGCSGLYAAKLLGESSKGLNVVVVEAADIIGGRVRQTTDFTSAANRTGCESARCIAEYEQVQHEAEGCSRCTSRVGSRDVET